MKAQGGTNAAVLIAIIAGLIILYIIFLPPWERERILEGGQGEGAHLIDVIAGGRMKDASSLGYTMLLKYPEPVDDIAISEGAPVSNQLIEIALLLAHDLGIKHVYAYSRPGALASYLSTKKV